MPYWLEWLITTSWMTLMPRACAALMRSWYVAPGGLEARIDDVPVVRVIAVVIEPAPVLDGRRDPERREAEIPDVIELGDQALEVTAPLRISGLDAIAVVVVIGGVAVVEARGEDEVDGLLAEVRRRVGGGGGGGGGGVVAHAPVVTSPVLVGGRTCLVALSNDDLVRGAVGDGDVLRGVALRSSCRGDRS